MTEDEITQAVRAGAVHMLRTEVERLRALLREGVEVTMPYGDDGTVAYWRAKARRALEPKP